MNRISWIAAALIVSAGLFAVPHAAVAGDVDAARTLNRTLRHWTPSDELEVDEAAEGVFIAVHKSPVSSNSLVVFGRDGSCLFVDTPWTPAATETLVGWIENTMGALPPASLAVNTHFHLDRLGGNSYLKARHVPIYGPDLTVSLMKEKGDAYIEGTLLKGVPIVPPDHTFPIAEGLTLDLDGEPVIVWYPGAGHTRDNVVVYLPKRHVLFGGCLVKSMAATDKGNTADADLAHWAASLEALKTRFPDALVVVPGHGAPGGMELIDHTIDLVK